MRDLPLTIDLRSALVRESDAEFRKLIFALTTTSARMVDVRSAFGQKISVSGVQYNVLMAVARLEEDEGVGIADVARYLHLPMSQITREVNACIAQKLLNKRNHTTDGRRVTIRLTRAGEEAIERVVPFVRQVNNLLFKDVTKADMQALKRFLDKFLANTQDALDFIEQDQRPAVAHRRVG